MDANLRIGVDTGGTFTDLVVVGPRGLLGVLKVPSTPGDPSRAVLRGLRELGLLKGAAPVIHGTTVATNAFLQRKGGRTALVATAGFEDLLILGRQARPRLFSLDPTPLRDWIPRRFRIALRERSGPRGELLLPLRRNSLGRLRSRLRRLRVEAVAVCFLHSYANPDHELAVARALRGEGWHLSLSHRIANEFREYERTCTTVANAVLGKPLKGYLLRLAGELGRHRLKVMASSGGWITAERAAREPIRTILSGPAGGALGAILLARAAGIHRLITADIGGTSTDISLCDGTIPRVHGTTLDGIPLRLPCLDIQSVGAGGGSIARIDAGGALRVGPESAGADPGPACYGRGGGEPTVTDAHLLLGRLPPAGLLGGTIRLDAGKAREAVGRLARKAGLPVDSLALGIVRVAEASLEKAIREISAGRGRHPREFTLLVFGGAGGLHACALAASLGIRRILVPKDPGTFSALGLCCSPPASEASRTVLVRGKSFPARAVTPLLAPLEREAREALLREGHPPDSLRVERQADLRYAGQSHELTLPVRPNLERTFHRAHRDRFGYARPGEDLELVTLRVRVEAPAIRLALKRRPGRRAKAVPEREVPVVLSPGRSRRVPFYRRDHLAGGHSLVGPALVVEYSATTWVGHGFRLRVDSLGNLHLFPTAEGAR